MIYKNKSITREDIEEFLQDFGSSISKTELIYIKKFMRILKYYENMPMKKTKFYSHFIGCCWAQDFCTSGPDPCQCLIYFDKQHAVLKIIDLYQNYFIDDYEFTKDNVFVKIKFGK